MVVQVGRPPTEIQLILLVYVLTVADQCMVTRRLMARAQIIRRFNVNGLHVERDWGNRSHVLTHHRRQVPFNGWRAVRP